jgi:outer membrane protein TolC
MFPCRIPLSWPARRAAPTPRRGWLRRTRRACFCAALVALGSGVRAETLAEAWALAASADQRLLAGRLGTAASQQTLQAAMALRWPGATLQAGYTQLDETPTAVGSLTLPPPLPATALSFALPLQQPGYYAYKAELSLPLYTGGRIEQGIEAAAAMVGAARSDEQRAELDLRMAVAQAYVRCLRAARLVQVAQSSVDSLSSFSRDVGNLFEQGLVARNDTLAAAVALAEARLRRIEAGNGLDLAQAAYNRLLGRDFGHALDLQEIELQADTTDIGALTAEATARRPELATLGDQGSALRAQAASVRGGLAPQVALVGSYAHQQNRYQAHEGIASIAVGMSWALFDGGRLRHEAAALLARADAVAAQREDARSLIALQVRQAWLATKEAAQRTVVAGAALGSAEENLRLVRDRYSHGMAIYTEVLQAETLRTASQTQGHAATYDALLAQLQLRRATGTL